MAQATSTPAEAVKAISRHELTDKIDRRESFVLLETLSPEHFHHVHLLGARNAARDRVKDLAPVLIPNKNTEVVTFCAGPKCTASAEEARVLTSPEGAISEQAKANFKDGVLEITMPAPPASGSIRATSARASASRRSSTPPRPTAARSASA